MQKQPLCEWLFYALLRTGQAQLDRGRNKALSAASGFCILGEHAPTKGPRAGRRAVLPTIPSHLVHNSLFYALLRTGRAQLDRGRNKALSASSGFCILGNMPQPKVREPAGEQSFLTSPATPYTIRFFMPFCGLSKHSLIGGKNHFSCTKHFTHISANLS
jgi:hypothetical protein